MTDDTRSTNPIDDQTDPTDHHEPSSTRGLDGLLGALLGNGVTAIAVPLGGSRSDSSNTESLISSNMDLRLGTRLLAPRTALYQATEVLFLPVRFDELDADDLQIIGIAALYEKPIVIVCLEEEASRIPASMSGYVHILTAATREEMYSVATLDRAEVLVREVALQTGMSAEDYERFWTPAFEGMRKTSREHAKRHAAHQHEGEQA